MKLSTDRGLSGHDPEVSNITWLVKITIVHDSVGIIVCIHHAIVGLARGTSTDAYSDLSATVVNALARSSEVKAKWPDGGRVVDFKGSSLCI